MSEASEHGLPVLPRLQSHMMSLNTVQAALAGEQWRIDSRLLLFGVRCARRLLAAAMGRVPISEITTKAIDTLEHYAKGEATVAEAVAAGGAARAYCDSIPLQAVSRILEQSIAGIGVPVVFAEKAVECASALSFWAQHMHAMLAGAAMVENEDRYMRYQLIGNAVGSELSYQHADLVDLFCHPAPAP